MPTINFEYGTERIYAVRAGGFSAVREWASASSVRQRGLRWNKRDHQTILEWAEKRGAHPATVKATMRNDEPGVLRLDFEPKMKEDLERITWDKFFEKFDRENLALIYQEKTADGHISRFHKFVDRALLKKAS